MLNETTISTLNALKLFGMAKSLAERVTDPKYAELDHAEFVGLLVQDEKTHRENQRLRRLLKNARLRFPNACLEDINYRHQRELPKAVINELASTAWIEAHRNVLFTGPTGIGKSWIACALGNLAARAGAGTTVEWDGAKGRCTNLPELNQYIRRAYRRGWKI